MFYACARNKHEEVKVNRRSKSISALRLLNIHFVDPSSFAQRTGQLSRCCDPRSWPEAAHDLCRAIVESTHGKQLPRCSVFLCVYWTWATSQISSVIVAGTHTLAWAQSVKPWSCPTIASQVDVWKFAGRSTCIPRVRESLYYSSEVNANFLFHIKNFEKLSSIVVSRTTISFRCV